MAYVSNNQDEQQNQNPAQGPVSPAGGGAVHLAPSSGVGSAAAPGGAAPTAKGTGGQFATLQNYVDANQGQAQPLANNITSGVTQQYNTLQGNNQSTLQGIQGQVNSGSTAPNQNIINQEIANPVSFASNPSNIASFQQQANNQYTGPQSAEGSGAYQNQMAADTQAASTAANLNNGEAGLQQTLQQTEAAPNTSVTGLNEAILSKDPNALSSISAAYQPFSGLTNQLTQGAAPIDQSIAQNTSAAQGASNAANQAIANQSSALNSNINSELAAAQKGYQNYTTSANNLGQQLQSGQLPTSAGVDQGLASFISGNINPWISQYAPGQTASYNYANAIPQMPNVAAPTIGQAASANDFATLNALNQLSGSQVASPLNGLDASQAGSYKTPALPSVNNNLLAGDIQNGFGGVNANVNAAGLKSFDELMAALQQYQGVPQGSDPYWQGGPGWNVPTIS